MTDFLDFLKNNPKKSELISDAINFARNRKTLSDYEKLCSLKPKLLTDNREIRMEILTRLIHYNFILIENNQLYIDSNNVNPWTENKLLEGNEDIWEIAQKTKANYLKSKKFDSKALKEIGDKGEIYVFEELKKFVSEEFIRHISLFDDTKGYDIETVSIKNPNKKVFLEIKTSVRPYNLFEFFLSRKEYTVGINKKNWYLVFVNIINNKCNILGYLQASNFQNNIPLDIDENIKWASIKVKIEKKLFIKYLP